MIRLAIGFFLMIMVAIGFGFFCGMMWMKEKYELWSEDEIKQKLRNN